MSEKTLRDEIERAGERTFVADADFLRHPEDTRTNIVFKNPTPNDEFVLKFVSPEASGNVMITAPQRALERRPRGYALRVPGRAEQIVHGRSLRR